MKSKLIIALPLLLLVLALDGPALAGKTNNGSPAFSPDGVAAAGNTQRRRRPRRRRSTAQRRRPRSYQVVMSPDEPAAPEPQPAQEERPTMAAPPPPPSNTGMDTPGRVAPKKSGAPRIKPPTVSIKPPTR